MAVPFLHRVVFRAPSPAPPPIPLRPPPPCRLPAQGGPLPGWAARDWKELRIWVQAEVSELSGSLDCLITPAH